MDNISVQIQKCLVIMKKTNDYACSFCYVFYIHNCLKLVLNSSHPLHFFPLTCVPGFFKTHAHLHSESSIVLCNPLFRCRTVGLMLPFWSSLAGQFDMPCPPSQSVSRLCSLLGDVTCTVSTPGGLGQSGNRCRAKNFKMEKE